MDMVGLREGHLLHRGSRSSGQDDRPLVVTPDWSEGGWAGGGILNEEGVSSVAQVGVVDVFAIDGIVGELEVNCQWMNK